MNLEQIVGEIDAEIEKLQRIRAIIAGLLEPKSPAAAKLRPVRVKRAAPVDSQPEPRLVVLPPQQRREYTRRVKPILTEPKALAAPVSNGPVFVPKAALRDPQPVKAAGNENDLEGVMRRKLLGGAA